MLLNINLIALAYVVVKVQAIPAPAGDAGQGQSTPGPVYNEYNAQADLNPEQCGELSETYGIIPTLSGGSLSNQLLASWQASGCDQKMCQYWHKRYAVFAYQSYTNMPDKIKASWFNVRMNCDEAVGPYTPVQCDRTLGKYGIVPFSTWGTAPPKVTKLWNSSKCSSQLCYIWKIKYDVVPFGSYGSLPDNFKKIWDHPNVQCKSRVYVKQ
ncbi:hypothetical protein BASA61_001986 [Batrachochytrium salamandrivorans]|nr:hypothetical protein BASA61_001986 [Batrachochytrium salamandrivorans]KAJ1334333.1 hypothetical protein BSLG_008168 [Batrachochytrium salamandrivorans]